MAFTNETDKESYQGDGANVTFAIPFQIISDAESEVQVYLRDESVSPASQALKTLSTHYTIVGANVVMNTAPTSDQVVVVVRYLPFRQTLDLITSGAFLPESHEEALDRIVAMIQMLDEKISRAPLAQISEQVDGQFDYGDPVPVTVIGWDDTGEQVVLYSFDDITADLSVSLSNHLADATDAHDASAISVDFISGIAVSNVQEALAELASLHFTYFNSGLSANRVLVTDSSAKIAISTITTTELGYLSGVSSNIQTQLNTLNNLIGAHITSATAHTATHITVSPTGNLSSTNVQAALEELQASIDGISVTGGVSSITSGTGISVNANTGAVTITNSGVTSIIAGSGVSIDQGTGAVTISATGSYTDEQAQDAVASLIQNGTGLTWTYVDGSNTLTGNVSLASFSTTNLAEGSNLYFTDERAQDAVGNILTDSSKIDFTYNDAGNTITATIVAASLVNADISASAAIDFSKLATLTSGNVLYGVTNVATSTALNTIAVTALTGTANQIIASASVGSITLSTPQSIGTGSSPTFAGLTLSGLGLGIVHSSSGGVLSSSLIVNADVSASAAIAYSKLNLATSIVNGDISASAAIAFSKLASLTSAHILVGSAGNVATDVAVTGDISLTNAGVTAYSGTVPINKGGTNLTSYTTGDLIYASATNTLLQRAIGSSGDILTVSGGLPTWASLATAGVAPSTVAYLTIGNTAALSAERAITAGTAISFSDAGANSTLTINNTGVTSAIGTSNQVNVSGATGAVTFSLPQSIATTSTPTFAGVLLNGTGPTSINVNSVSTNSIEDITSDTFRFQSLLESHSSTAATCSTIAFIKSRGTNASPTAVAINDAIGFENFYGYTGNSGVGYQLAAQVQYWICADGTTVSTTSMPGRIQFFTTADLSVTPTERMRINCTGTVSIFSGLNMAGSTISGDSVSGGNLTLKSTSNATKGSLIFDDIISVWPSQPTVTATQNVIGYSPTFTANPSATMTHSFLNYSPTVTANPGAGAILSLYYIRANPSVTLSGGLAVVYNGFSHGGTFTSTANPGFANTFNLFNAGPSLVSSTVSVPPISSTGMFLGNFLVEALGNVNVGTTAGSHRTFSSAPTFKVGAGGASSAMVLVDATGYYDQPVFTSFTVAASLTVPLRRTAVMKAFQTTSSVGTVIVTANVGYDIEDQPVTASPLTVTRTSGIRSALVANAANYFIDETGGAQWQAAGKFTKYNNVALVSAGLPYIVATVALTAQTAAIAANTLITPSATGRFRISVYMQVTTAGSTSSILGGATGVVITYNDGVGNVAQSRTMAMSSTTGTIVTTAAGNTSTTNLSGEMFINARTGVAIQYAAGYTSVGVTPMQFAIDIKVEAFD